MARLYDHLMVSGAKGMPVSTVVSADNVSDYFWGTASAGGEIQYADFPNATPPLRDMFVEARRPDPRFYSRWPGEWPTRFAGHFTSFSRDEILSGDTPLDMRIPGQHWLRRDDWTMCTLVGMVFYHRRRGFEGIVPVFGFPLDGVGRIALREGEGVTVMCDELSPGQAKERLRFMFPLLLAISFMHCKNVEQREIQQPPKLSKKWEKKHGRPLVRYHVLDIDPMRKVLRDEGGSEETGLKRALHICRGHFAHYPEGLFGRGVPETVWRPQHTRGSAKHGAVVKDYNIKAPAPTREET